MAQPCGVRALRAWKAYRERTAGRDAVAPAAHVFVKDSGCLFTTENQAAATFRALLERAGVARAQLFERSDKRRPVRAHDTRSGFITIALACGRSGSPSGTQG